MSETNPTRARVLVVDRGPELAEGLRATLAAARPEIVHLRNTTRLEEAVTGDGPWDVVVAGPSEDSRTGLGRLAALRGYAPDVGLLLVLAERESTDLQALVKARPDELVQLPVTATDLRDALIRTLVATAERRGRIAAEEYGLPDVGARCGQVYVVGGPTGGSGKTMAAVNLAALLRQSGAEKVTLVDLDVQFGEVTAALRLKPVHTLYDVLFDEQERPVDETTVAETLAETLTFSELGARVLPAPRDPVQADAITAEQVATVLRVLRKQSDYVVVDTPTGLNEITLAALDQADHLVAVAQVDVPGVANLRTYLETIDQLGVTADRRSVILNKELVESGVSGADAVEVLGAVAGVIPFDAAVPRALNEGVALCMTDPGHAISQAFVDSVRSLLPAPVPTELVETNGHSRRSVRTLLQRRQR